MRGISSSGKEQIKNLVERFFDKIALKLLGNIPSLRNKKSIFFIPERNVGLGHIFVQAMNNKQPNQLEEDVLKGLLESSHGYIEAVKHNTRSNITEQMDGLIRQAHLNGDQIDHEQVQEVINEQLNKAKNAVKMVAESEGTKVRNVGSAMDISRVAAERGIEDPNVFFIVIRDSSTCQWCKKNHLMEDGTPKVFKLSEIRQSYLSNDEKKAGAVSVCGAHPNCRCTLSYLSPGFGFKRGKLDFIAQNHDEYAKQRS